LVTGLAPEETFAARRLAGQETANVQYYRCTLVQPLEDRWPDFPGCLHGQSAWTSYRCLWGVIAPNEDEARRMALAQQAECFDLKASVAEVEDLGQTFNDKPGVVWQGARWCDETAQSDG
jgi:hypothetical protein